MQGSSEKDSFFQQLDEESEEWRSPADYYFVPDNVTRGLTLAGVDAPPPDSFKGLGADVDFYREPAVNKAVASCLDEVNVYSSSTTDTCSLPNASTKRFTEENRPPHVPAASFFQLTLTTLRVLTSMPHEIGNILLDFLTNQVASTLSKVNHNKFSIKGDVFENFSMCTMKVKVFQEQEHFAIEFQRRKGDALTFHNVFSKASNYFKSCHLAMVEGTEILNFTPPPPLPEQQVSGEASLAPLLDLAKLTGAPNLQAEAAVALATMAEDNAVALQLCTGHAFQDVKMFFHTSAPELDYPAAHLVYLLAQRQEAATHFAQQGILPLMMEKVRSVETSMVAREEFARGLRIAAQQQSKATLPHSVELAHTLSECIQEVAGGVGNDMLVQNLHEAQIALSSL